MYKLIAPGAFVLMALMLNSCQKESIQAPILVSYKNLTNLPMTNVSVISTDSPFGPTGSIIDSTHVGTIQPGDSTTYLPYQVFYTADGYPCAYVRATINGVDHTIHPFVWCGNYARDSLDAGRYTIVVEENNIIMPPMPTYWIRFD